MAVPFALLVGLFLVSERRWEERANQLERTSRELRVRALTHALHDEQDSLIAAAGELARAPSVIALLGESGAGAAGSSAVGSVTGPHPELATLEREELDALIVVTHAHALRFSAGRSGGALAERPPEPELMRTALEAVDADGRDARSGGLRARRVQWRGGAWVVASPVLAGGSSGALLGEVLIARSLAGPVARRLGRATGATVVGHAWRAGDAATPPAPAAPPPGRQPSNADSGVVVAATARGAGAVSVVPDDQGRPCWEFELETAAAEPVAMLPQVGRTGRAIALGVLFVLLAAAGRWYLHSRRSADARYKAIIDQSNDGIVAVDARDNRVLFTNPAFLARLGYSAAEAQRLTLADIFADGESTTEAVLARLRSADSGEVLYLQQRCKSGALIETEVRCNALDVNGRRVLAYLAQDVSLRRKAEQQLIENQQRLDRLAHHDQLTGLPNRHYLAAFLPDAIASARASGSMLGVVFLDLDRFKHINDTRGHETGDKLLQEVARRMRGCVRDSDVVVRMGGDEFVFVFRNLKSYDEVTTGASRIIEALNLPVVVDGQPLQTSGSVGVSLFPRDGADMVELLKHSDMAMYQAKDRGRNNVQLFSPIMNRRLKRRVAVEASLRDALRLKQLDVFYQPFVDLITRKVVGLEALIRWRHPRHGMIPADQFIPVAEETGLVVPLGNFVLHRTLQNMSAWRAAGVTLVPVSLNVASHQLQRGELQSTISTLLATHGLGPELLQLEMTERAVFDSGPAQPGERRQDTIARLRDIGIKIAIDDFGTGYSSLSYLKHWRVDALKIDRSFIRDLVTDSSDLAIVSAIVAMARQLRISVIAEGIEGYQQAEILSRLGCTLGQGYLFARPMPADQCLALLRAKVVGRREDDVEDMLATLAARG